MPTPPAPILKPTPENLRRSAQRLRAGGLVVMPTETVYGLAANALDPVAVAGIFRAKARPAFDPLIVHVADVATARRLACLWPRAAQKLAEAFWPGPLTLVVPKADTVPDLVSSGLPSVGLRWPAHRIAQALIRAADRPIAAPSANRFGSISPTRAEHAAQELQAHLDPEDVILDGGPCQTGVESTVIGLVRRPTLLRPGGIAAEAIEQVLGQPLALPAADRQQPTRDDAPRSPHQDAKKGLASPGMLDRHYAPATPLTLFNQGVLARAELPAGTARLQLPADPIRAAAALFTRLRALDNDPAVTAIYAERFDNTGLGRAINDRLTRAADTRIDS